MVCNILIACGAMLGVTLRPASGYSLEYYDCRSPTRIDKFARPTACDPFAADEEVATGTTFEVLTMAETIEVSGWSFEVIHSEWRYRCGVFSHMKLSGVPNLLQHSPVTGADYRGMTRQQEYIPEGCAMGLPLRLNTWNYFQVKASGDLEAFPDCRTCQGQETRHGEELVKNELVLLELRVMVRDEKFLVNQGNIESVKEHLQLPCTVREEGCQTSAKTYLWRDKESHCNLHRVRTIAPNRTRSTWLVDHRSQLLLNVSGTFSAPGCDLTLQTTQIDNIYLADLAKSDTREKVYKMPQLDVREVEMQQNTAVALDYVAYQLSRQIEAAQQTAGARIYKQQHKTWDSTPIQIQPILLFTTHGDMLYKFRCPY
ncbi:MAG: hypothetical protein GY696_11355 [Gammaproteobacteria bacterium]|nr:hypothetical protein [Gammaproteobacteria bacterium]